ncbi:hypothetical protein VKS41_004595 [Umbelopsis sp. WA50703]
MATAILCTSEAAQLSWEQAYAKAKAKVAQLSLEDKVSLGTGIGDGPCVGNTAAMSNASWPGLCLQDSPLAVRLAYNVTGGIAGINVAASFDRKLTLQRGHDMGQEFHGKGINIQLGPDINMARVPEAGRNWEGFGEDPYLTGTMGALTVTGVQAEGVISTAKHFILNEQETDRTTNTSIADERTIHEIYAWPFARAVEAGLGSVMCSYNQVNYTYACENDDTMNKILKEQIGFQGFIQSDWGATHSGSKALMAGLDMDMPGPDDFWGANLVAAAQNGTVPMSRVDDAATRILATYYKLGQDSDFPKVQVNVDNVPSAPVDVVTSASHKATVRSIGAASVVVLKNNDNILPLTNPKTIGVIGQDAGPTFYGIGGCTEHACYTNGTAAAGWGSGGSYFFDLVDPLQGITNRANQSKINSSLTNDLTVATQIAKAVDVAIVFVQSNSGEGSDRPNITLWNNGDELVSAVAAANPNTIVVVHTPSAVLMPWVDSVKAVINAGLPGEESGNSLADVLFGDVNPSGRLPYTIAVKDSDYPAHVSQPPVVYSEKLLIGYRWFDTKNIEPLFPFGHGLSYTNFTYSNLKISNSKSSSMTISASIQNSGKLSGAEVPQLYIGFPESAGEPLKILRGFDKLMLNPGQTSTVTFPLNVSKELSIYDVGSQSWKIAHGQFKVYVGASSRDIRLNGTFSL